MPITLSDLVANRTLSADMAVTMAAAADERRSMLFVAIPRMAGKSTVMRAALAYAPPETPIHTITREAGPGYGIPQMGDDGYLVLSEISPAGFADYLWGAAVRKLFESLRRGFSLATALHAGSVEEAFEVLTVGNGVPDEVAGRIDLVAYIRSLGPWQRPLRRVIESIHEISDVAGGRVESRLLHRWDEHSDEFNVVERPARVGLSTPHLEAYRAAFRVP